ncbi:hypothetical protein HO133_001723 [Letharia lupina]|uniref:Brl1/Brr6 domain-containing protein n=1 Tax=Letharia lupina TaxID=560253 RepID=A0A8H6CE64_9LECA|nr:uncharacterized protein HO133_001723 [Letharia lupina]KAF6221755.1 hypothetical protein HO133_001723 [Letharia lupina]
MKVLWTGNDSSQNRGGFTGQKRSASFLDSPSKTPVPSIGPSGSQIFLPPSTPSTKPPFSFRNFPFTTPQKSIETDFSSGAEMSSPVNVDTDDTPEPSARRVLSMTKGAMMQFEGKESKKKPSSPGLLSKFSSLGRGEVGRRSHLAVTRSKGKVQKRRRRDGGPDVRSASRRSNNDSDFEEPPGSGEGTQQNLKTAQQMGFIPSVLTFIDAHPGLPNTLSYYVQFLLNFFLAFCVMYVLYGIFSTISNDITERAMMESSEILAEMAVCAREFQENKCERDSRVPAMETVCNSWEKCMQRDPYKVGRSRLSAGMFAEIVNSFIEPISLKAIIVSVSVIVGCFTVNNLTFGLWRAKTHHPPPPQHPAYMHHSPQQQIGFPPGNERFYIPYQNHIGMQGTDKGGYGLEGQSPTKRLGYR